MAFLRPLEHFFFMWMSHYFLEIGSKSLDRQQKQSCEKGRVEFKGIQRPCQKGSSLGGAQKTKNLR